MNVKQLINILQDLNPDSTVWVENELGYTQHFRLTEEQEENVYFHVSV